MDLAELKARLLCAGLRIDEAEKEAFLAKNSSIFEKGFEHAVHLIIEGVNVNVCVAEKFCAESPFELRIAKDNNIYLYEDGKKLMRAALVGINENNTAVKNGHIAIKPHSDSCLSLWPSLKCAYAVKSKKCKFCSIGCEDREYVLSAEDVIGMFERIFKNYPHYAVNISGGTCGDENNTAEFFIKILKGLRAFTANPVSLELVPPSLPLIDKLKSAGASELIMNLEIYDETLRKEICPGKAEIPRGYYFEAYRHAVKVFGEGAVSGVLIVGIQPPEDIKKACRELVSLGVVPTLIPFKPMDDCELKYKGTTDYREYLEVSRYLSGLLTERNISPFIQGACTRCGGCSLETVLSCKK